MSTRRLTTKDEARAELEAEMGIGSFMISCNSRGPRFSLAIQLLAAAAFSPVRALRGRRWYRDGHSCIIRRFAQSMRDDIDPPVIGEHAGERMKTLEEVCRQIGNAAA